MAVVLLTGNMKAQMDLLWSLCYYAQVRPIAHMGLTDRFALLHWVQERTRLYKNVNVVDFVTGYSCCA